VILKKWQVIVHCLLTGAMSYAAVAAAAATQTNK